MDFWMSYFVKHERYAFSQSDISWLLEKTLESPLDCKEIQPTHSKGDQSLVFIGRIDVEAETPILWWPDAKSWLTGKDPDVWKTEGRKRRVQQRMRWLAGITERLNWTLPLGCLAQNPITKIHSWAPTFHNIFEILLTHPFLQPFYSPKQV